MHGEKTPHYAGHRQRIKQKYLRSGIDGWYDHEVLEFLLSYAIPRRDTKPLAKTLLSRFSTFAGVLDAPAEDIAAVPGLGMHGALLLKLSRDLAALYHKNQIFKKDLISSPGAAVAYLHTLLKGAAHEEFHAIFLNAANHCISSERIGAGTVNRSAVYPRTLAERALACHATGVILAHNHPAGTLKPSDEDIKATTAVARALATVDVTLLDHLIVAGNGYFSFKEQGLL